MQPQSDGRTYVCGYCGTRLQAAIDGNQLAAGLRLDLANVDGFLMQLAQVLHAGFGEAAKIHAQDGRVLVIELNLGNDLFIARREPHGLVAQHKRLVRGVALKTVTHPTERWLELLTTAMAQHANTNARAAQALAQLRGG